jgi:uroporphyrinogen decarboxylase
VNFDLDLQKFWAENEASLGKPFRTDKPRAPITLPTDDHWLLEEMQLPSTVRYYQDAEYRAQVNRACNDRCQRVIGLRPFPEKPQPPAVLRIEHVMGARTELTEGGTPWLEPGVHNVEELRAKLDELERLDDAKLRDLIFSTGGVVEKAAPNPDGTPPVLRGFSRGPATIATSVIGTTEMLYWLMDYPEDMSRFFAVLADIIIRYHRILGAAAGVTYRGMAVNDDNCALFSPGLYEEFCYPAMRRIFDTLAPDPADDRFQHSDSDMEHLLPILARMNFKAVNLGPNTSVKTIRQFLPHTEIQGEVAPFTLRNKPAEAVIAEVRRDFDGAGADGGLLVTTAGSIAAGTKLEAIRTFMWAVHTYCRYDK